MISVVVNFFNNRREAPNTLHSLTSGYQNFEDYEVICIDNGSPEPLADVTSFGPQFKYRFIENASVSPAAAINAACREARGSHVMVMIDGAHIVSPGAMKLATMAFKQFDRPFVATTPFHLGPTMQNAAVLHGYSREVEDNLLASVDWKTNGYRLFQVSADCADMSKGWFGCLFESGCYAMTKADYLGMGGLDERFTSPGGGMVNLDFFQRALLNKELDYAVMVGEATFHQYHDGVATSAAWKSHPWEKFHEEFKAVRGEKYFRVPRVPFFMGTVRVHSLAAAKKTAIHGFKLWEEEFSLRPQEPL